MIKITRHKNHKLYVPAISRYTNLTELKDLVQSGHAIQVTDDKTGEDISALILSQILQKTEAVPANRIAELIRSGN